MVNHLVPFFSLSHYLENHKTRAMLILVITCVSFTFAGPWEAFLSVDRRLASFELTA